MSVHAASELAYQYHSLHSLWMRDSRFLVCLACADRKELTELYGQLHYSGQAAALWLENDLNDEPTAFAVIGDSNKIKKLLSKLPLAFKEKRALAVAA